MKIEIQVRDGLSDFDFIFEGREIAHVDTEKPGRHQWVEMDLYWAEPGQDGNPLLRLPEGGYVTHVVGQSVRAHRHNSSCKSSGQPVTMQTLIAEALPCPDCKPDFPRMRFMRPESYKNEADYEVAVAREERRVYTARARLAGMFDLETPRHNIRRSYTPQALIIHIIGERLSWPAEKLLREAADADPDIKAAMEEPAIALALHEALVASGRVVLS